MRADVGLNQIDGSFSLTCTVHEQVRTRPARLDGQVVHRLDGGVILLGHRCDRASSLLHIPLDPSQNSLVRISLNIHGKIKTIADRLRRKQQDPLHDDHVRRRSG